MTREILAADPSFVDLISATVGATIDLEEVRGVGAQEIVVKTGRVTLLRYAGGSADLDAVRLDDELLTRDDIGNLESFRELLERLCETGQPVVFCLDTRHREMFMVNVVGAHSPTTRLAAATTSPTPGR